MRDSALALIVATGALKLKGARYIQTPEGIEIKQRGRPDLLLTYEAAIRFVEEIEEAENG